MWPDSIASGYSYRAGEGPPISAWPVLRVALLIGVGCLGILLLFTKMAHEFYARHIFVLLISMALTLAWSTANLRFPAILASLVFTFAIVLIPARAHKPIASPDAEFAAWLNSFFTKVPTPMLTDSFYSLGLFWHLQDPSRARLQFVYDQPERLRVNDPRITKMALWAAVQEGPAHHVTLNEVLDRGQPLIYLRHSSQESAVDLRLRQLGLRQLGLRRIAVASFDGHSLDLIEPGQRLTH